MVDFTTYREVSFKEMLQTGGAAAGGLTVRDYFAANALMSMLSPVQNITDNTPAKAADLAYKFADAMMKERSKKPEEPTPTVEEAFKL